MNIGCVIYTKNTATGEMTANWSFDDGKEIIEGTGHATGIISNNYVGKYKITYFDKNNINVGEFDLIISKDKNTYVLKWYKEQILKFTGIALIVNSQLIGGWKPV